MADAPKKKEGPKKPDAPPTKDGHQILLDIIGVFIAIVLLTSALSGNSLIKLFTSSSISSSDSKQVSQGDFGFWQNLYNQFGANSLQPSSKISVGSNVVDQKLTQVRREPGGSVIGIHQRGEKSTVTDGPVEAYGASWWMVNYESSPSGWVDSQDIVIGSLWFNVLNFPLILWGYVKIISLIISIFFILVIIYVMFREPQVPVYDEPKDDGVDTKKPKAIAPAASLGMSAVPPNLPVVSQPAEQTEENARWKHVGLLMQSHNPSDWRQAIIEADVLLEDMLDKMGYEGVSIGDKLKNIEKGDFQTIDKAWEAHKVRNRIAHDGGVYKLSYDEVSRVIGLYNDVFKEFYWV